MVLEPMQNKRQWQPREQRLLSEFLASQYPTTPHMTRVRLGVADPREVGDPAPPPEVALVRVFKRWVDGIILLPQKTILIEAKIRLDPGAIAKLHLYHKLFIQTPEFKERWHKPVEEMLVFAIEDPVVIQMAREEGIRSVPFHPPWIDDYLRLLAPRDRRAPRITIPIG